MARIIMADNGLVFDGRSLDQGPLGGIESDFIGLADALAARGHDVLAFSNCDKAMTHNGVAWKPVRDGLPAKADLYIANHSPHLIPLMPGAARTVFWLHNRARHMLKWKNLRITWKVRPVMVFLGAYHLSTYPWWAPGDKRLIIPLGIDDRFRKAEPTTATPGPRAIFTSNPQRSLDWLLDIWEKRIRPAVPGAELHAFSGTATYGAFGAKIAARVKPVLDRAASLSHAGVVLHDPVPKDLLVEELRRSRALLYRGDRGETFCLALGESQAMGVPAVVRPIGSVAERIIDGETGVVATTDEAFAEAAIKLLTDDALWLRQHTAALSRQRGWGWADAAVEYEKLIP